VSCIKNLPGHIYGTMECINQIKQNYLNNDKSGLLRFSTKFEQLSKSAVYSDFLQTDERMKALVDFSAQADEALESFYAYENSPSDLFAAFKTISDLIFPALDDISEIPAYVTHIASLTLSSKYSDPEISILITSLVNMVHAKHDLILLHIYSTLDDVERIFMLPYEIDRQKYTFKNQVKSTLAIALFNYQLTLEDNISENSEIREIISELGVLEKELKDNINKLPENYEAQHGKIKVLLLKLKELYADNIDHNQLNTIYTRIYDSYTSGDTIKFEEIHQKLRSVTNSCIQLFSKLLCTSNHYVYRRY
jgi:hypothetical protein